MKRIIFTIIPILLFLMAAGTFFFSQYLKASQVVERVEDPNEVPVLSAKEIYTSYAEPVADSEGVLYIPDDTAVSNFTATKIKTRHFSFDIPERWAGNVVLRVQKVDETEPELVEHPLHGATRVQIYEKNTYAKYRTQEHAHDKNAENKGKLTEILYLPHDNNMSELDGSARQMRFAYVIDGDTVNDVYLLQLGESTGMADDEYKAMYAYLIDANYAECILHSFVPSAGTLAFADGYIANQAKVYLADTGTPELPEDYIPLHSSAVQEYNPGYEAPKLPTDANVTPSYNWKKSATVPWAYSDNGNMYPFSAQESGGAVPSNLTPGTVQ